MLNFFTKTGLPRLGRSLLALGTLALLPLLSWGQSFTPGNLVLVRVGDGNTALGATATATFLDEYTTSGTLVRTVALPTTAAATGQGALTLNGSSTSEGTLNLTTNGQYLALGGYNVSASTSVSATASTTSTSGGGANNRIVGRVAADGTYDTSTRLPDGYSGTNIRSAAGTDGTAFWTGGAAGGVRYVPFGNGNATATTVVAAAPGNNRVVFIANGQLYVSAATTTGPYYGIASVGTGLPTTAGQTSTVVVNTGTASGLYQYAFLDLNPLVTGVDVVYLADNTGGLIQKWTYDGTTWTQRGTITLTNVTGLAAVRANTSNAVTVYVTTSPTAGGTPVSTFTDPNSSPTNSIASLTLSTAVASPGTNKAFRGLAFAPQAVPTPQVFVSTTGTLNAGSTTPGVAGGTVVSYDVSGQYLTAGITVTAPFGYEVSLSSGSGFGSSVTTAVPSSAATGGLVAATRIYVRLSGAGGGTVTGNVANASTGATTQSVAVTGTVPGGPALAVSPTSLSGFGATQGTASAAQSYTLTGSNLTAAVTVTAPTGYEVSQTSSTAGFAATQSVAPNSGSVNTTIYVRLRAAATAGNYSGNVTNTSAGAATQNVAVSGSVVNRPTGTPGFTSASTTFNAVTLNLQAADGTNLLVVVRPNGSSATAPTDQTTYTANTTYGSGSTLGSGYVVFAAPNAASVTVTNLTQGATYVADIYTYNVGAAAGSESYGLNSGTITLTIPVQPPAAAGLLVLEENYDYPSGTVLVANGNSTAGTAGTPDPVTGWTQSINSTNANALTTSAGNLNTSSQQYPQGVLSAAPAGTSSQVPMMTSGQDIFKLITQPAGATAIYGAALVTVTATQATGDYFLHFINGAPLSVADGAEKFRARVYARAISGSTTTFSFGLGLNAETPTYGTAAYTLGATYLVVFKYENSAATANLDAATLYALNPTVVPTSEPLTQSAGLAVPTITTAVTTNFQTAINAIAMRQGAASAAPTVTVDALRIGSGWGTAVGRVVYSSGTSTVAAGDYYSLRVAGTGTVATVSTSGPGNGVTAPTAVILEKQLNLDGGQVAVPAATSSFPNPLMLRARNIVGDGFSILANGGTSYVDGPVSREVVGSPSLLFPVGRSGNYRPMTLNISAAPGGTTIYTGVQMEGSAYTADPTVNAPLTRVSRVRYFTITPNPAIPPGSGTFQGKLQLSFGSDDAVTDPSLGSFVMAKSDGSGWSSIGRSTNGTTTLTSDIFQDFSFFSLASTAAATADNPLPVELTAFTAVRAADKSVALTWTTASEKNSSHFEAERSLDGKAFEQVARVQAQGSSAQAHRYTTRDVAAPAAQLYYRLRAVDQDGKATYSPTMTVAAGPAGELTLSPNPTHEQLSLVTELATAYVIRNTLGQVVLAGTTAAHAPTTLSVAELAGGLYLFELQASTGRVVYRFVKN